MNLQDAYFKVKDRQKAQGYTLLVSCRDFGDFWGFMFMPPTFDENNPETWIIGRGMTTINKKTGVIENRGAGPIPGLPKGTPIPIEQFAEYNVAV